MLLACVRYSIDWRNHWKLPPLDTFGLMMLLFDNLGGAYVAGKYQNVARKACMIKENFTWYLGKKLKNQSPSSLFDKI